jgi:hypothetical protein
MGGGVTHRYVKSIWRWVTLPLIKINKIKDQRTLYGFGQRSTETCASIYKKKKKSYSANLGISTKIRTVGLRLKIYRTCRLKMVEFGLERPNFTKFGQKPTKNSAKNGGKSNKNNYDNYCVNKSVFCFPVRIPPNFNRFFALVKKKKKF